MLVELAHEADLFADAGGGVEFPDASRKGSVKLGVNLRIFSKIGLIENRVFLVRSVAKPIRHITNKRVSTGAKIASSAEFYSANHEGNWQNRGRNWNRGRYSYHGNQSAPGRNSNRSNSNEKVNHQVNFCKVKG